MYVYADTSRAMVFHKKARLFIVVPEVQVLWSEDEKIDEWVGERAKNSEKTKCVT